MDNFFDRSAWSRAARAYTCNCSCKDGYAAGSFDIGPEVTSSSVWPVYRNADQHRARYSLSSSRTWLKCVYTPLKAFFWFGLELPDRLIKRLSPRVDLTRALTFSDAAKALYSALREASMPVMVEVFGERNMVNWQDWKPSPGAIKPAVPPRREYVVRAGWRNALLLGAEGKPFDLTQS